MIHPVHGPIKVKYNTLCQTSHCFFPIWSFPGYLGRQIDGEIKSSCKSKIN